MTTQTKTAHTAAPLEAGTTEYGTILKNGLVLYRLCRSVEDLGRGDDQKLADSKLYAAAPEMLFALERAAAVVKCLNLEDQLFDTMGYVRGAIQKARGGR